MICYIERQAGAGLNGGAAYLGILECGADC